MRNSVGGGVALVALVLARLTTSCGGYDTSSDPRFAPHAKGAVRSARCTTDPDGSLVIDATIGADVERATYTCERDTTVGSCEPDPHDPNAECQSVDKDFGPHWGETSQPEDSSIVEVSTNAELRAPIQAGRIVAVVPRGSACVTVRVAVSVDGSVQNADLDACCGVNLDP